MKAVFTLTPRKRTLSAGPLATELLAHQKTPVPLCQAREADDSETPERRLPCEPYCCSDYSLSRALSAFIGVFAGLRLGAVRHTSTPQTLSAAQATEQLKAFGFFLGADLLGVTPLLASSTGSLAGHRSVLVVAVGFKNTAWPSGSCKQWLQGTQQIQADTKAAEIAVLLATSLRARGIQATSHLGGAAEINLKQAALNAGLAYLQGHTLRHPLLQSGFGLAAISTALPLMADTPLVKPEPAKTLARLSTWLKPKPLSASVMPPVANQPMAINKAHLQRCPLPASLPQSRRLSALSSDTPSEVKVLRMLTRRVMKMPPASIQQGIAPQALNVAQNQQAIRYLAHYLGADQVGFCALESRHWRPSKRQPKRPPQQVILLVINDQRATWAQTEGTHLAAAEREAALLQSTLIAQKLSYHLATLGFNARFHTSLRAELQLYPLLAEVGLLQFDETAACWKNPLFGEDFHVAAIATNLPLVEQQTPERRLPPPSSNSQTTQRGKNPKT